MRVERNAKSPWRRRFAWYPIFFGTRERGGKWVWWEPYYACFSGLYTAIALPEEMCEGCGYASDDLKEDDGMNVLCKECRSLRSKGD